MNPDAHKKTIALLEKLLAADAADWETRLHLAELLAPDHSANASQLLLAAPNPPPCPEFMLPAARVLGLTHPDTALQWLQQVLNQNKAEARAYLERARILHRTGQNREAEKNYHTATLLDPSLSLPEFEETPTPPPAPKANAASGSGTAVMPRPPAGDDISEDELNQVRELLAEVQGGKSAITFRDVGGMDAVKERVRLDMILPFQKPELYAKFGRKAGGGLLLYGPPGCGKTLLARATAGECGAFFSSVSIPEILSKWMGESEQHLHQIFEVARRKAPSILFFDEIDALGVKRSEAGSSMATLVNVFLTEVDGASADNTNVFVLAATNMPWRIDSAFRRPGRFDRVVFVPPPDETARRSILDLHLEGLPHRGVDSEKLAKRTERFSGADLKALVNAASEQALMRELNSGVSANLTQDDLDNARKTLKPSTLEWLETAANYASYANAAGLYDDLAEYLKK